MPTNDTIYDFLAERFRAMGRPEYDFSRLLEDAEQAGYTDIWEIPTYGLTTAMRMRGLVYTKGKLALPAVEGVHFDPIATDFAEFKAAAKRVVDEAEEPVPPHELISRVGLQRSAMPLASMRFVLKQVGIHYLVGAGYWRSPQYRSPEGWSVSRRMRSDRIDALSDFMDHHGWPFTGKDAERITKGMVTARYLTIYAASKAGIIRSIGGGLFVPTDKWRSETIPISKNVAHVLLDIDEAQRIDDKEHLRLFRICILGERHGWLTAKKSRTTRDGIRRQTLVVKWLEKGISELSRAVRQSTDIV